MDHLPRSGSRRLTGKQPPPAPLLTRCKSENQTTSPPPPTAISSNKSTTFTKSRSISTTKTTSYKQPEPKIIPRKKPTSPSAWALSPGRVAPCPSPSPVVVKPPSHGSKTTGGGLSGVFKYFRPKKTASSKDASVHSFKLMNNRLLQWRFANVRGETTMSVVKAVAEKKIFNVWLEILAIRSSNMVKQVEVQKLKNDIRLYHILNSQMFLLDKWSGIEAKNCEAVGRVVRKLIVASLNIPMLHDSKGDVLVVRDMLGTANTLIADIESAITKLSYQAEKSCYELTELSIIAKQELELLTELQTWMTSVSLLKEKERSLQAHLVQLSKPSKDIIIKTQVQN